MDDVIYSRLKFSADPITLLINKYIIIHNNETCSNSQYSAEKKQEEEEEGGIWYNCWLIQIHIFVSP